ncbi:MAG: 30S ribosome-binding factor RbfA [Chromatiaceae bacterium]|jgi:ribosome-binding factor A
MKEYPRSERIGPELQRELAGILRDHVKDPRLGLITIQEVRVSHDLAHAKVFFTCFPVDEGGREQERLLNGRLAGFLRHELAHRIRLRGVPELRFVHDDSVRRGEELAHLIDEAVGHDDAGND